jgi:hypothetical protein
MSDMIEEGGLMESLEEDMKALKDAGIVTDDTEEEEEPKAEPVIEEEEKPKEEEKPAEEPKPEEEPEPKDASGWAKHRREKRELEAELKRLKDAAAKPALAPVAEPKPEIKPEPEAQSYDEWIKSNPKPDKDKDLAAYLVWNAERAEKREESETIRIAQESKDKRDKELVDSAMQEIEGMHETARKSNSDYDNAITHARAEYTKALKLLNPHITEKQVKATIDRETFLIALECNKRGLSFADTMYDAAIERFGYVKAEAAEIEQPANKPNLKLINSNKKKSASPLEGGGQRPKGKITLEAAADMSPAELQALSAEDWNYLQTMGF